MEESTMKMFREAVVKMANTYPNKPLSDDQNNIIRDQFNRFFSVQRTPEHPPYAWMIERALRELREKGGSTEESISNFIRKEYDDLPWFHSTLLNHHLLELCKCGNVFRTRGQRYSLVGADSSLISGKKCRRKQKRRKRHWDWQIKQRKLRKKCIHAKRLLQKKDQVHEKHNCFIKELKQQNIEAEIKKELCIVGEDMDQIEISTPEGPPGYDTGTSKESSHLPPCGTENPSGGTHPMRGAPKVMAFLAEGLSGPQEQIQVFNVNDQLNHKEEQIILSEHEAAVTNVNETLQHVQPMTRTSEIELQCIMEKEDPAMPSQKGSVELHSQKVLPKSELTENTPAVSESEPVNLGGGKRASHVVFKYQRRRAAKESDISCRIQKRKEEQVEERQLKCQGQKHLDGNTIASSFLQQHLQECGFSYSNEQENVKFNSPGKRNPKQLKCILALPVVLEEADSKRFNHLGQRSEVELQLQTPKNHAKRRVSLEAKPLLRPLHSMPEQPEAIATDDFSLSCHQHDVQEQHKYNLRSRSLKAKPCEGHE